MKSDDATSDTGTYDGEPVEVLHETHIGRLKIRDRFGYEKYVDADEVGHERH
jgi:hypothetical protein